MSHDKLQQIASSLVKSIADNEKFGTPYLAAKIQKHLQEFPEDQTLGSMSLILNRMVKNNAMSLRRADLRNLYTKLYSRNTKFGELFRDELGMEEVSRTVSPKREDSQQPLDTYHGADPVLANALQSAFDQHLPVKMYSQALADHVKRCVAVILDGWGLKPSALHVEDGNDQFLVIKADYETPKGITSFYVPVETPKGKALEPTVFLGNKQGLQPLNHTNLKTYLTSHAGEKLQVQASDVLGILVKVATEKRDLTDAELAVIKLNAKRREHTAFSQNQIVGQKIVEASVKDVELPKSDEFVSFEKQFSSPAGLAVFQFGADKIKNARDYLVRELVGFGYSKPQVAITGHKDQTVFYGVSLDAGRVGFTVPIKIANDRVIKPTVMVCNGSPSPFTKDSINQLYVSNQTDFKAAASASPMFELKPNELIETIRQAMSEDNHAKAQDALNVLRSMEDKTVYALGFQAFKNGLMSKPTPTTTCSKPIKTASSTHMVCSHTGLPLHKVYQDKDGNCRPIYRKGMDETYQGGFFMTAKILG
jgi:hypothetical protein